MQLWEVLESVLDFELIEMRSEITNKKKLCFLLSEPNQIPYTKTHKNQAFFVSSVPPTTTTTTNTLHSN